MFSTIHIVKNVLEVYPETRGSDELLYIRVCEIIAAEVGCPCALHEMPLTYFLRNRKRLGFPHIETVGRMRRKLQEGNPELRADPNVEAWRSKLEMQYKEFARNG